VALGIRLFGRHDSRRYALRILNAVLGENMSSRLFQVVREKHGLAYAIHSSLHLFDDSGALVVSAGLDQKKRIRALRLIAKEIVRLKRRPVGGKELKRAKEYVIGQLRLGLESTSHQMMWIGDNIMSYGRFIPPDETIRMLSRVTAADVQKLACSIIKKTRVTLSMVSPGIGDESLDETRGILKTL